MLEPTQILKMMMMLILLVMLIICVAKDDDYDGKWFTRLFTGEGWGSRIWMNFQSSSERGAAIWQSQQTSCLRNFWLTTCGVVQDENVLGRRQISHLNIVVKSGQVMVTLLVSSYHWL